MKLKKLVVAILTIMMSLSLVSRNTTVSAASYTLDPSNCVIPVTLKTGVYYSISLTYTGTSSLEFVVCTSKDEAEAFVSDPASPEPAYLKGSYLFFGNSGSGKAVAYTTKKRTAYLTGFFRGAGTATVTLTKRLFGGQLKVNKAHEGSGKKTSYYKFVTKKAGYINVTFKDEDGYDYRLKLLKKNKKTSLSGAYETFGAGRKAKSIAVKAGTYYLQVKTDAPLYTIKYAFYKRAQGGGASKKKALKITAGKKKKGTIYATGNKTRWYKFKQTKTKKLTCKLTCDGLSGNKKAGFKLSFYYDNYGLLYDPLTVSFLKNNGGNLKIITDGKGKAYRGYYYVKVSKTGKGCGTYTITFK